MIVPAFHLISWSWCVTSLAAEKAPNCLFNLLIIGRNAFKILQFMSNVLWGWKKETLRQYYFKNAWCCVKYRNLINFKVFKANNLQSYYIHVSFNFKLISYLLLEVNCAENLKRESFWMSVTLELFRAKQISNCSLIPEMSRDGMKSKQGSYRSFIHTLLPWKRWELYVRCLVAVVEPSFPLEWK